jgi:diguanylate cyclase
MMIAARKALLPWLILVAGLCITWLAWDHERRVTHKELHTQFDFSLRETVSHIEQRMSAQEQMLLGVQSLLAATDAMDRRIFHDYINGLRLDANFSGVKTVGIAKYVPAAQRQTHIAAMQRHGFSDYAIQPDGLRAFFAPIIQLERGIDPPGFDAWTKPALRLAMEQARDSGMARISGNVAVDAEQKPGFVMYMPIYARGQAHENIDQRRASLFGWAFAVFRMEDLMASFYGERQEGIILSLFDGVEPSDASLLYRSADASKIPGVISANEYMVIAGHDWMLSMSATDEFETRFGHNNALMIAGAGTGLSILLALLAWLQLATRTLTHLAQTDSLTGLLNRRTFFERAELEAKRCQRYHRPLLALMLDIDHFKQINDVYGHQAGDYVLGKVAKELTAEIRSIDILARYGGEEFVVQMQEIDIKAGLQLAERIRAAIEQMQLLVADRPISITVSIGIAQMREGETQFEVLKRADAALYQAKREGRNRVVLAA